MSHKDFIDQPLTIGDRVVWRGLLKDIPGLVNGSVVKFTKSKVWIEHDHWYSPGTKQLACVEPTNLIKVPHALP